MKGKFLNLLFLVIFALAGCGNSLNTNPDSEIEFSNTTNNNNNKNEKDYLEEMISVAETTTSESVMQEDIEQDSHYTISGRITTPTPVPIDTIVDSQVMQFQKNSNWIGHDTASKINTHESLYEIIDKKFSILAIPKDGKEDESFAYTEIINKKFKLRLKAKTIYILVIVFEYKYRVAGTNPKAVRQGVYFWPIAFSPLEQFANSIEFTSDYDLGTIDLDFGNDYAFPENNDDTVRPDHDTPCIRPNANDIKAYHNGVVNSVQCPM